jgi:hypothetical protein
LQKGWSTWDFQTSDPISVAYNNWNNDSCLPIRNTPCSGKGYPVYVVNASQPEYVQAAVDFARNSNVRLIVKATGHDFRGRSVAANSLSIWMHHLKGLLVHDDFQPRPGRACTKNPAGLGPAITVASGETGGTAFAEANKHGLMINVGGGPTVGQGGYATGGGHSIISAQKGLAADNILELNVVTPDGKLVTANECNNPDLYWGLRGGGGSTLGVVLNLTVRAFPSEKLTMESLSFSSTPNATEKFWDAAAYVAGQLPKLSEGGLMAYAFLIPGNATQAPSFGGTFGGLNMTAVQTHALLGPIANYLNTTWPDQVFAFTSSEEHTSVYDWWSKNPDNGTPAGVDIVIASRLLDAEALTGPSFKTIVPGLLSSQGALSMFMISGPGVHKSKNDFTAVTPAWRKAYVHSGKVAKA